MDLRQRLKSQGTNPVSETGLVDLSRRLKSTIVRWRRGPDAGLSNDGPASVGPTDAAPSVDRAAAQVHALSVRQGMDLSRRLKSTNPVSETGLVPCALPLS